MHFESVISKAHQSAQWENYFCAYVNSYSDSTKNGTHKSINFGALKVITNMYHLEEQRKLFLLSDAESRSIIQYYITQIREFIRLSQR